MSTDNFNQLTPAETERLALLMEECGEVVHVCGKILRHGYESIHPYSGGPTNRVLLEKELGDIEATVQMMHETGDIADCAVKGHAVVKRRKIDEFLHHQSARLNRRFIN